MYNQTKYIHFMFLIFFSANSKFLYNAEKWVATFSNYIKKIQNKTLTPFPPLKIKGFYSIWVNTFVDFG